MKPCCKKEVIKELETLIRKQTPFDDKECVMCGFEDCLCYMNYIIESKINLLKT